MRGRRRANVALAILLLVLAGCEAGSVEVGAPSATPAASRASATPQQPTTAPTSDDPQGSPTARPTPSGIQLTVNSIQPIGAKVPERFKIGSGDEFASFNPGNVLPAIARDLPEIAPDLSNVEITALLAPEQLARMAENGFVVSPSEISEFFELYERARYDYMPVFVTSDSLLHVYHLLFDKTLRRAEMESFSPMLARLDWELLKTSVAQYEQLQETPWAEAARRNAAYFAIAVKLLNPDWPIPPGLEDLVEPDMAAIEAHQGFSPSAIFPAYPFGEDWSQYVPRGHYTKNDELKRYFLTMMWHGRMTFRAEDQTETQQAALLVQAINHTSVEGRPAQELWSGIYEPTVFFVGRSDDLTPKEYREALEKSYGVTSTPQELLDDAAFGRFRDAIRTLRPPKILGMVISDLADEKQETQGLRFMGQRFVPDAFVFRQLIHRNVPNRRLPKALDFFAALGSARAEQHLQASGDTALENYAQNLAKLQSTFAGYEPEVWTQNLYWAWIHSLRPLLEPAGEGYPQFMRSEAWQDKQLTAALGSWTELKRDTILYAKQVYAEMGAGGLPPPKPVPPKGYVEPVPEVFARIAALTDMTIRGLDERGLISDDDQAALNGMLRIAKMLQTIAEKQLRGETPSEEEYEFLRFYGAEIEALTYAADDESPPYSGRGGEGSGGDPLQAAVVADVATDPDSAQVLEEAVGRIFEIYVIAPVEGRLVVTKGGVFSHYEFAQPMSERLTDEQWREMLDQGQAPPLAEWTSSYLVEQTVNHDVEQAIRVFNDRLVKALWFTEMGHVVDLLSGAELQSTQAYVDQLQSQKQFVGMTLASMEFLSFDFQDKTHVTVTTRERWSDELYSGSAYFGEGDPVKTGLRGPYQTVATYTMERKENGWVISRIVTVPPPPAWQPA